MVCSSLPVICRSVATTTFRPARLLTVAGSSGCCSLAHAHRAPAMSSAAARDMRARLLARRMIRVLPGVGAVVDPRHGKARLGGIRRQALLLVLQLGNREFLHVLLLAIGQ